MKKGCQTTILVQGECMADLKAIVVWADNTQDHAKDCCICGTQTCIKPVHREQYKIRMDKIAADWERDNPVI